MINPNESSAGSLQTVDRALELIELLSRNHSMTVAQMARDLEIPRASVYHLLTTLKNRRLVQKRGGSEYGLSLRLFELGSSILEDADEVVLVRPILEELSAKTRETIHYGVLDQGDVVYVDKIDSEYSLRMFSRIGRRSPSYCTGLGKALLAGMKEDAVREVFGDGSRMQRFTQTTHTSIDSLLVDLREIAERGFSIDNEEHEPGIKCVAASITDSTRRAVGAISISAPIIRFDDDRLSDYSTLIVDAAREISRKLSTTRVSPR